MPVIEGFALLDDVGAVLGASVDVVGDSGSANLVGTGFHAGTIKD